MWYFQETCGFTSYSNNSLNGGLCYHILRIAEMGSGQYLFCSILFDTILFISAIAAACDHTARPQCLCHSSAEGAPFALNSAFNWRRRYLAFPSPSPCSRINRDFFNRRLASLAPYAVSPRMNNPHYLNGDSLVTYLGALAPEPLFCVRS